MLCASFSPGGMFLATGCADHHVRVYVMFAPEGPERILEKDAHSDRVDSIQWANSGLRFISGSKDGTALIWRYENSEWCSIKLRMTCRLDGAPTLTAEEQAQKLKVTMVTWSRDDRYLITAVSDFSIKLWDSTTGKMDSWISLVYLNRLNVCLSMQVHWSRSCAATKARHSSWSLIRTTAMCC